MRKPLIIAVLLMLCIAAQPQDYDSIRLARLPKLEMPARLKTGGMPYKVDNSRNIHFPAIFTQFGWSCNQAASIAIGFTYELNAMRNLDARLAENRLPAFFTWNMMNSGKFDTGVSYFESWDMVDAIGHPSWSDYGGSFINESRWMDGYYRYYRGMMNRVEDLYSIDVSTEAGLLTLKHWLLNHMGEYSPGGVANFQLATLDLQFRDLPDGTEEAGKKMIPFFNYAVGHAMTFTGYNDSVRFDFNGDGRYTNNLDINADGQVDMRDYEIGALICVNTYGTEWGSEGRAYVPYRILPLTPEEGGIWQKSVVVAKPRREYQPQLTLRARIRYPDRSKLWITAGASQDPAATQPDQILDQPVFHYQGGALPMQGQGPANPERIEIGIDASPLLARLESGRPAAFFLVVCELDPDSASSGEIEYFSFSEYSSGETEHPGVPAGMAITQAFEVKPVVFTPLAGHPVINNRLPGAAAGQDYRTQLNASGGKPPYRWNLINPSWEQEEFTETFPVTFETKLLPEGGAGRAAISLPFSFPYRGREYRDLTITAQGGILLEENYLYIPYGIALREMLGLNRAIYPFYSTQLIYSDSTDGVYCRRRPNQVTVYWNASMNTGGKTTDVNFTARLTDDGTIEFFYGDFVNRNSVPWLIGLTGGSRQESFFPAVNASGIRNGLCLRFQPTELPDSLQVSPGGELSCLPGVAGKTWKIPVSAEDSRGTKTITDLILTTGATGTGAVINAVEAIRIWPNPVTDRLNIDVESTSEGDVQAAVYDITGKAVIVRKFMVNCGKSRLILDAFDGNGSGIYVLELTGVVTYRSKFYIQPQINTR